MSDPETPNKRQPPDRGDVSWNQALLVAGLAVTIPGLLFAPPAAGYWLDTIFLTYPTWTLVGFVVGLITTAIDAWQILRRIGLVE